MRVAVLDANAFWTERLFRQCNRFADVLLLNPRDFRTHRRLCGTFHSDRDQRPLAPKTWRQQVAMPPGWMVELWPWTQRRLARIIRNFWGSEPATLVITYPQYRGLIPALNPALSVYYNLDDYRDNWPRYSNRVAGWEHETVEGADLTICIADHRAKLLREAHPQKAASIHHLPIGVTPEFMREGAPPPTGSAPLQLRGATAGYIGALNFRFDFALIADVAALLPEVTFLLGGRVQEDGDAAWRNGLARARATVNIRFLGWVDHTDIARHLHSFDVLLIPYTHCRFNTNACPAKLWDYLGTGKPIVANDANPETLLWREVVQIGASPVAFASAVSKALAYPDPAGRERRLEIARAHTWEKLSQRLEQMLLPATTAARK